MNSEKVPVGRFAPSPTGRMHLGNVYAALMSYRSVKERGGKWILRIEDLDGQRSKMEYARQLEDDLLWLGLEWDEGGIEGKGPHGPYCQSQRGEIYAEHLSRLQQLGMTYPCTCTRADIMATQAPHQSDGRIIYGGKCRPKGMPTITQPPHTEAHAATRLWVPDRTITFRDRNYGEQSVNLARECGDFLLRRADGAWAYQLAVVIDDALMRVTEVVRGVDLLLSSAQQIYLYELFGYTPPEFAHIPLLTNSAGQRLAKRDKGMDMGTLRQLYSPEEVLALASSLAGNPSLIR